LGIFCSRGTPPLSQPTLSLSKRDLVQGLGFGVWGPGCRARGRQNPDPGGCHAVSPRERVSSLVTTYWSESAAALSPPDSYGGVCFGGQKGTWRRVSGRAQAAALCPPFSCGASHLRYYPPQHRLRAPGGLYELRLKTGLGSGCGGWGSGCRARVLDASCSDCSTTDAYLRLIDVVYH